MEVEPIFWAALQSSFILGLIHGVNPCGHSWLVLSPFVMGEKNGRYVSLLTISFVGGTAIACLILGSSLGVISSFMPHTASIWVDTITSVILFVLGLLLIYNPELLHSHSHNDDHDHSDGDNHSHHHHHEHNHSCAHQIGQHNNGNSWGSPKRLKNKKWLAPALFGIGFINMIIPCPTAAVMYGYALNSGSVFSATAVFGSYAFSTAIAVSGVIYLIFRVTAMASRLQKHWIESLIMRLAGLIIVLFSIYGLYSVAKGY